MSVDNPSILFISTGPDISNPRSGQAKRLNHLSRGLADEGWSVFALVPAEHGAEVPEWMAQQYTYEQWSVPFLTDLNPSYVRNISRVLKSEDIDIIHSSAGVCVAVVLAKVFGETSVVYAAQNVEADHARDFVNPKLPRYKQLLAPVLIPWIERLTVACADGLTTVSHVDRERFQDRYALDETLVWVIPTGTESVNIDELDPPSAIRDRYGVNDGLLVVFHGYYAHPPNREAAELIDAEIAPAMREKGIDAEFLLVGEDAPDVVSPNVHTTGFVEDLYSVLNAADLAVVPIRHGSGTKTKIFDYISVGLPFVATEKAAEGIDIEPERHALFASDVDDEFISQFEKLAVDPDLQSTIRQNLLALAAKWNWSQSTDTLNGAYRDLLGTARPEPSL